MITDIPWLNNNNNNNNKVNLYTAPKSKKSLGAGPRLPTGDLLPADVHVFADDFTVFSCLLNLHSLDSLQSVYKHCGSEERHSTASHQVLLAWLCLQCVHNIAMGRRWPNIYFCHVQNGQQTPMTRRTGSRTMGTWWNYSYLQGICCPTAQWACHDTTSRSLHTLVSVWWISIANAGRISRIISTGGGGSLLRQRFTMTHVTFLRNERGTFGLMNEMSGLTMPRLMT